MIIHLALFDQSFLVASENSYWTWKSSSIPKRILDDCYYTYIIKQKPEKTENILASDLFGGAIILQDWVVVYRFYNGGRDEMCGRPGRYIVLTGWIKRDEINNSAPSNILSSETFEKLAIVPPPCPTPEPSSLDMDISDSLTPCNSLEVDGKYTFPESSTVEEALSSFFGLCNNSEQYELVIRKTDTEKVFTIQKCINNINNTKPKTDEHFMFLPNSSDSDSGDSENDIQNDSQLNVQKGKYLITPNNILLGLLTIVIVILLSLFVIQNYRISIQEQTIASQKQTITSQEQKIASQEQKIIMQEQKIEILEMNNTRIQKKIEELEGIVSKKNLSEKNESL